MAAASSPPGRATRSSAAAPRPATRSTGPMTPVSFRHRSRDRRANGRLEWTVATDRRPERHLRRRLGRLRHGAGGRRRRHDARAAGTCGSSRWPADGSVLEHRRRPDPGGLRSRSATSTSAGTRPGRGWPSGSPSPTTRASVGSRCCGSIGSPASCPDPMAPRPRSPPCPASRSGTGDWHGSPRTARTPRAARCRSSPGPRTGSARRRACRARTSSSFARATPRGRS